MSFEWCLLSLGLDILGLTPRRRTQHFQGPYTTKSQLDVICMRHLNGGPWYQCLCEIILYVKCVKYCGLQLYLITSLINHCECHELVLEGSTFHIYLPTYHSGKLIQHSVTGVLLHLDHDTMQTKVSNYNAATSPTTLSQKHDFWWNIYNQQLTMVQ